MKKVMLVSNNTWALIQFRSELIKFLLNLKYQVELISPGIENWELSDPNLTKTNWSLDQKGINLIKELKSFIKLRNIYSRSDASIILQYTIKPSIYGSLARIGIGNKKVISIITGLGFVFISNGFKAQLGRFLYRISLKFSDEVWFLNNDDKELFLKKNIIPEDKVFVLPGEGVNVEKFYYAPLEKTKPIKILFFGRLLKDKGLIEYLNAAKHFSSIGNDVEFQVLGKFWEDNPSSISKKEFEDLKQSSYVKYLGETTDVRPYIENVHVVCLPSYREGVPVSLLEAGAMGKILIASNVPGCKDVVINGVNGYLFEPRSVESLISSIYKVKAMEGDQYNCLTKNSRERVVKFYSCDTVNSIIFNKTRI